jgi:hypothetical protein
MLLLRLPGVLEAVGVALGSADAVEAPLGALVALWTLALRTQRAAVVASAADAVVSRLLPLLSDAWARRGGSSAALRVATAVLALTADSVAAGGLGAAEGAALAQEVLIAAESMYCCCLLYCCAMYSHCPTAAGLASQLATHAAKVVVYAARSSDCGIGPAAAVLSSVADSVDTAAPAAAAVAAAAAVSTLAAADPDRAAQLAQAAMRALVRAVSRTAGDEAEPAAASLGPLGAALAALARGGSGAALARALQPLLDDGEHGATARRLTAAVTAASA